MLYYLALAIVSSTLLAIGLLVMKSRAGSLPTAIGAGILHGACAWLRDPVWVAGLLLQLVGYALYVIAVAGSPVSMLAVMMQGGIALFVLFSVVFLGERARPREWAGIAAILAGMVLLSFSLASGEPQGPMNRGLMALVAAILIALVVALFTNRRLAENGAAQAIGSGILFGLASLFTKGMTDTFLDGSGAGVAMRIIANPWVYAAAATNLAGLVMIQNSFHQARAIITMPLSSALSNLVPIAGGMLVFGESLPQDPVAAAMRIAAFALTVFASVMLAAAEQLEPISAAAPARDVRSA